MKAKLIDRNKIKVNPNNPRIIKDHKFKKLVKSVEDLPQMLQMRPIIVDENNIIKDNIGFGEWDWDILGNEWDNVKLGQWGLDVWQPEEEVDYSILDDLNIGEELHEKQTGVKRAIQIEFDAEHYEEANKLINKAREDGVNLGLLVLNAIKNA